MTTKNNNNFYENVIDLNPGDILFFDTNVIMALLFKENDFHLAVKHFFVHAISYECKIFTSNIVYKELLYVLARELYCQHCISTGERTLKSAKSNWPNLPKSRDKHMRDLVKQFNTLAIEKIRSLIPLFEFGDSTIDINELAFHFASKYNLHSADAYIAGYTQHLNASLVSLDKDVSYFTEFNTYFALINDDKPFNVDLYIDVESHNELYTFVTELLTTN